MNTEIRDNPSDFWVSLKKDCSLKILPHQLFSINTRMPVLTLSGEYVDTSEEKTRLIAELAKIPTAKVLLICADNLHFKDESGNIMNVIKENLPPHTVLIVGQE